MKLHRNLCEAVVQALAQVILNGQQADRVVDNMLTANRKWGSRDRHFVSAHIYDLVRYKRLYEYICNIQYTTSEQGWLLLAAKLWQTSSHLPDWSEWKTFDIHTAATRKTEAELITPVKESVPDWLYQLGEKEVGPNWPKELHALNQTAPLCLRVNTLKAQRNNVEVLLKAEGITYHTLDEAPEAIVLESSKNLRNHPAYKNGLIEVQDVSSQQVAPFVNPKPGEFIIDACAGGGGKSLHLAAIMQNRGNILSMDVHEKKLYNLTKRAERAGATIITSRLATDDSVRLLKETADKLLLDVPCSGSGVWRRKPDARWHFTEEKFENILSLQQHILESYSTMLKPGGEMVYATCSVFTSENEKQIERFIADYCGVYELVEHRSFSPSASGFDGFFMAKIKKLKSH